MALSLKSGGAGGQLGECYVKKKTTVTLLVEIIITRDKYKERSIDRKNLSVPILDKYFQFTLKNCKIKKR